MSGLLSFTKLAFAAPRISLAAAATSGNTMAARAYATKKLFVANIAWGTTDEESKEFFAQHATLKDAYFPKDPQGRTKGYGFLEVEEEEVERFIQETNGRELNGREVRVDHANPRTGGDARPRREFNSNNREFRPRGEFRPRRDNNRDDGGDRSFRRPRRDQDDRE
ncbi:hypothetical protein BG004_001740 [Podila humilis]|nr:hypothetical protein BG004_001740 [Podila humilis]